jgi:ABC-type transport system involved in multi-copper enzyme maturation permease subunit
MSSVVTTTQSVPEEHLHLHDATPSFFGLVRGEFFKLFRQWVTWIMLVCYLGVIFLPYIIEFTAPDIKTNIQSDPLHFYYNELSIGLSIVRVFSGIYLLMLAARMVGLEYQLGTIRVLLSRGVGRLQLLFAKMLTVAIVALVLLIIGLALNYLMSLILVAGVTGNLNAYNALTGQFWSDAWTYVLTILLNMAVTILLAMAAAVVGRSLSFGLSAALVFFPIDNIGTVIMELAYRVTHSDFWLSATAYFLGPNLNTMPTAINSKLDSIGASPLYIMDQAGQAHGILVDGTHTVVVAIVYGVIFAAIAIVLTWRRDVMQ